jgi:hypothetical protein
MDIVYSDKCWYEIQEQKEVLVWYTGIYWRISSTAFNLSLPSYTVTKSIKGIIFMLTDMMTSKYMNLNELKCHERTYVQHCTEASREHTCCNHVRLKDEETVMS